jgi:hypothetical protein
MPARHAIAAAIDLEYGHPKRAQMRIRVEAFLEMLESWAPSLANASSLPV